LERLFSASISRGCEILISILNPTLSLPRGHLLAV
jgi:hypothetical protein